MKIGFDARLYSQSGVGRYIRNLLAHLGQIDKQNSYVIFLRNQEFDLFEIPNNRWEKRKVDISWHTLAEQIKLPAILQRENCNLIHFPYFSMPILYSGKFILTIHDLIMDHFSTGHASSLPFPLFKTKQFGYRIVLNKAIKTSDKIIAVSKSTKREIIEHYHVAKEKIVVIYEACELPRVIKEKPEKLKFLNPQSYLLYVGNAYPHKNLDRLSTVYKKLKSKFPQLQLIFVGKKDFFYKQLEEKIKKVKISDAIFIGEANDNNLAWLYSNAICLVLPSLMEGFGLPALEAMSYGCPVVASNISSIQEIYGPACLYFDPKNIRDMEDKLVRLIKPDDQILRKKLIKDGCRQVNKYNWEKTARETLKVYESCFGL